MSWNAPVLNDKTLEKLEQHKQHYLNEGWVRIENFLNDECAEQFCRQVDGVANNPRMWCLATLVQGKAFVARVTDYLAQEPSVRSHFIAELLRYAQQHDFQYFYEFVRLSGEGAEVPELLETLMERWQSAELLDALKTIVDDPSIRHIDAQLTRYKPGHFLKQHSDINEQPDKRRKVAYILNLSRNWQADWGGLLHLQDAQGRVTQSLLPGYNTLTLFEVPTAHFVSQVTNYSPASRYSLTGWLWQ